MNIIKEEIRENIFLLIFENQYEVTSTFMRLQEFYESPFKNIRDHYFTLEKFMDQYAKENGNFTYNQDWSGFNVPDNCIRKFHEVFKHDLLNKEKNLFKNINSLILSDKKFYLIGIFENDALNHEISHGYYYLDNEYKNTMDSIICSSDQIFIKKLKSKLKKIGYCKDTMNDEIQAYLSTENSSYLSNRFELKIPQKLSQKFKEVFEQKDRTKNY